MPTRPLGRAGALLAAAVSLPALVALTFLPPGTPVGSALDDALGPHQAPLRPFDVVPRIDLPTDAGPLALGGGPGDESYVLVGYSALSGLSRGLWSGSLDLLLAQSPDDVHYVFVSYADDPQEHAADMQAVRDRAAAALARLADPAVREHWSSHLHFVTESPLALPEPVPWLVMEWGRTLAEVRAQWTDEEGAEQAVEEIGTTDSGWAAPLADTGAITAQLGFYGPPGSPAALGCPGAEPTRPVSGTIALLERGVCPFTEKVANARAHGAIGALLYTDDRDKVTMSGTCEPCPDIPVAMVDRGPGLRLSAALEAGLPVTVSLVPREIGVELLAVDHQGRARELGSVPFPFNASLPAPIDDLLMVAWGTQYLHYEHQRDARLMAEEAAEEVTLVPVFTAEWADDPGWAGKRSYAEVTLPDAETMAAFDTLEVDLALGCPDRLRANCPPWDYIADVFLCDAAAPDTCDLLVGRWITPYWAEGRWVTDITPLLGWLSEGGSRRLAFYTQQRYQVDMTLRLSNRGKGLQPRRAVDLGLNGGPFREGYNGRFQPIEFEVPEWAERVEIASYVTGHGFGRDTANCAEFCNHTHHISVNEGPEHVKRHPEAGTLLGCAEKVPQGVVPNQGGTWIYGRGGWCPGQDVEPWVVDVTDQVRAGERNRLTYRALLDGRDYVPQLTDPSAPEAFDASILMRTYLVFWARPDVEAPPVPPPYPTVTATPTTGPPPEGFAICLPWVGRHGVLVAAAAP